LIQPAGQVGHAPRQPVGSERGPLVCLPGRVPVPPHLGAVLTGSLQDTPGVVEPVAGSVERPPALNTPLKLCPATGQGRSVAVDHPAGPPGWFAPVSGRREGLSRTPGRRRPWRF